MRAFTPPWDGAITNECWDTLRRVAPQAQSEHHIALVLGYPRPERVAGSEWMELDGEYLGALGFEGAWTFELAGRRFVAATRESGVLAWVVLFAEWAQHDGHLAAAHEELVALSTRLLATGLVRLEAPR